MGMTRARLGRLPKTWVKSLQSFLWPQPFCCLGVFWLLSLRHAQFFLTIPHTLTVTPESPPCLATVSFKEPQFSKHWYKAGSKSILTVWGSSSWAWVSWLLTTWERQDRSRWVTVGLMDALIKTEQTTATTTCVSHLSSLVGCVLLEDVASSDHHPGRLYPVESSALLLLHQDLISKMQGQLVTKTRNSLFL